MIKNRFEFETDLNRADAKERTATIRIMFRKLFNIEFDHKIDDGEIHGPKEQEVLATIESLLDADYNCFDEFVDQLIFHIREEKCFE
jgi:hypothetical protein